MLDLLVLFGVGFSTGLSGAMIPGPLFLYVVASAFRAGWRAGVTITLGHLTVEALFVALIVFGLRELLAHDAFQLVIAWVGGIGLVLMGVLILRRLGRFSLAREATVSFARGMFIGGIVFSVISPGFLLWWATIGASVFLEGFLHGLAGLAMVGAGHAAADLTWHVFIAYSVEKGQPY